MGKINTELTTYIDSWSIKALIDVIEEVKEDSEISWNSFGGSVYAGQRLIDYLNNKGNKLTANISGIAASMGVSVLPFFDKVIGAKQADLMFHSISGGAFGTQKHTNEFLYNSLASKVNEDKFKEVTGKGLKEVMLAEEDERVNVWITGEQAGYIGLFDEVYDLLDKSNTSLKVDVQELDYELPVEIANKYGLHEKKSNKLKQINNNEMSIKDLTVDTLKKENSAVFEAVTNTAVTEERKRIMKINKYAEYDREKANEIIESGRDITTEDVEYFLEKKYNSDTLEELESGSQKDLDPAKTAKSEKSEEKTANEKEKEAALKELRNTLGTSDLIDEPK